MTTLKKGQDMQDKYLSRVAAGAYLGVCTRYIDRLVASGKLPTVRIGRRVLFDRADLDGFAQSCKTAAVA